MKQILLLPFLLVIKISIGQQQFQLAPPFLRYSSIFFNEGTTLGIKFDQPGAEVRYTINGKDPSEKDLLYTAPVVITGNRITIKARAIGKDFIPSEVVSTSFFSQGKEIRQINFTTPHPKYPGNGADMLHDNIGGLFNINGTSWLGYDMDTVEVNIELKRKERIQSVLVNSLQQEDSWIFLPEEVLLFYYDEVQKEYQAAGKVIFYSERPSLKRCHALEVFPNHEINSSKIKLVLLPRKKIPDWHPGKGKHAWLFIDEIKVY